MRSLFGRIVALAALATCLSPTAFAADDWTIAVGGGRITGYMGLLADRGMPREYLPDDQLADIEVLRRYRAVIITATGNPGAVSNAVAQFVAEGGIAITEERIAPPESVIAGKRLGPDRAPNIDFRKHDHPISQAMHSAKVVTTYARPGIAIIPDGNAKNATVIADYTEEGVPKKYRGKLTGGKSGIPAVLLIEHGRGKWLHFGPRVGFSLALRGPEMQPAILTALRLLSDGTFVPRFESLQADRRMVPGVQWQPETEQILPRVAPRDAAPSELPEGLEPLDLPEDAPADYVISGTLAPNAEGTVMLPWFSESWQQRLEIDGQRLRLIEVSGERENVLAQGRRPDSDGDAEISIRRRPRSVTVFIDGQAALMSALEPLAGTQAVRGIDGAFLQSCAPVQFTDDFMRAEGDPNPWETPAGSWKLFQVEGDPGQGANPFAYRAEAEELATATSGYWFWDDYDMGVSVRPNCASASLLAHHQAADDCLQLRLAFNTDDPADDAATLSLIRRTPAGATTLASADVTAGRNRWQRLRLRISRGHAVASLNERDLLQLADEQLRGAGRIGLQIEGGFAHFDDLRVEPWQAAPLPMDGGAWIAERGRISVDGREVTLQPAGSARAIAPISEMSDLRASAEVRRGGAESAGLLLRHQGPGDHYLLEVAKADGGGSKLQVVQVRRNKRTLLASRPLAGGGDRWHKLSATLRGRHMRVSVDGGPTLQIADEAIADGGFGLVCERGPARFREVTCWPVDHERFATDPETPPYAGIIDRHTWAGAGSGWEPAPDDLDLFWHRGEYLGDAEVRLGVHRPADGPTGATLLIGNGADPFAGYALSATQKSPGEPVSLALRRAGEQVAAAEERSWSGEGWALGLQRVGSLVVGLLDGEAVCEFRDPEPLEGMRRVGFRKDDALIDPADAEVLSSAVRTWTFEEAPADWRVLSGTWEISNRWSCSPDWTWLAGWNQKGPALIQSRRGFTGDQVVDIYVGTKMMPKPDGKGHYEVLRDLHFGLCGDGEGGGYRVILGGDNRSGAKLLRNGETVASDPNYRVPQSERHNNWLLVRLMKQGAKIAVYVWDSEVLSYTDEEPLAGGSVAVGTRENGITVPRVTVYGQPLAQGAK
jgi:hypothetical protein